MGCSKGSHAIEFFLFVFLGGGGRDRFLSVALTVLELTLDQAGLELRNPPASAVLELKANATTPGCNSFFNSSPPRLFLTGMLGAWRLGFVRKWLSPMYCNVHRQLLKPLLIFAK